jgi:hypothetical protein
MEIVLTVVEYVIVNIEYIGRILFSKCQTEEYLSNIIITIKAKFTFNEEISTIGRDQIEMLFKHFIVFPSCFNEWK